MHNKFCAFFFNTNAFFAALLPIFGPAQNHNILVQIHEDFTV